MIKGEELNAIVANVVAQVKKKRDKATATNDSGSKDDPENYNIENINIGRDSKAEWGQARKERWITKFHIKWILYGRGLNMINNLMNPTKNKNSH